MSNNTQVNHLGNSHYQILVIRLLVDEHGELHQCALVDLNERQIARFRQLEALPELVARWLTAQEQGRHNRNNSPDK